MAAANFDAGGFATASARSAAGLAWAGGCVRVAAAQAFRPSSALDLGFGRLAAGIGLAHRPPGVDLRQRGAVGPVGVELVGLFIQQAGEILEPGEECVVTGLVVGLALVVGFLWILGARG